MGRPPVELLWAMGAGNALTWAAYRLDKLCAGRQWRRISERVLLALALIGGVGAMLAMYAHRRRHKTQKTRFVVTVVLAVLLQVAALAGFVYLRAARSGI